MSEPDREPKRPDYSAVALVGQVGLAAAVPIMLGVAGGIYLNDRWGGTRGGLALFGGIVLGIAGAVAAVYGVIRPFLQ